MATISKGFVRLLDKITLIYEDKLKRYTSMTAYHFINAQIRQVMIVYSVAIRRLIRSYDSVNGNKKKLESYKFLLGDRNNDYNLSMKSFNSFFSYVCTD